MEGAIQLTIDRLADGEVSPYLNDVVEVGDRIELRGPIGGYFVWRGEAPLLLLGGGSGVVPLMAMLRHARLTAPDAPVRLLYSARTMADVIYADELGQETTVRLSRVEGRVTSELVAEVAFDSGPAFICGSHGFVEAAADHLLDAGYAPERILTERFGPSG
jgi:ferredoxin-NADP reductase